MIIASKAGAVVWQWSTPVRDAKEGQGQSRAFLWISPDCKKLKGVVVAQNNMEEQSILENEIFRKELGKLGFAEVWVSPAFDHLFNFKNNAGKVFDSMMADLGKISGYTELADVPVVPMGHSAAASWPYYFAAFFPERTLAAISVSGQWPYFRSPAFAPDIWGNRTVDLVPCLETMGEYEAADTWSTEGLKERREHPLMPLSMLANPGQGHFAATDEKVKYLAFYIKKAVQYRVPKRWNSGKPVLIKINPAKTGWLGDKWHRDQPPAAPPAPIGAYQGNAAEAFWYFDRETAMATMAYQARYRNLKPQLIGYVQSGRMVEQQETHQQVNLKFNPDTDGITFKIKAAFYDTVPAGSSRLPSWAQAAVGSKIGHQANPAAIQIRRITGPVVKINDSVFRVGPQRGFIATPHAYELWFAASHPGDQEYKPAVQQCLMPIPPQNTTGKAQKIDFNAIADQPLGTKNVRLKAVSDAGVPVGFYVLDGPAEINGDQLTFTGIPPRSKFPVKVTVVAWQYGNSRFPQLQTALPVTQTFFINKK
jgi:hypothetical protein